MNFSEFHEMVCELDQKPFPPSVSVPSDFLRQLSQLMTMWEYYFIAEEQDNDVWKKDLLDQTQRHLRDLRESYCEWEHNP